jgi:oxygen-independent coproporphyrinogen-3 oxidase
LKGPFLNALYKESMLAPVGDVSFDTVYLGGGTPSIFNPTEIGGIIDSIHQRFSMQPDIEVTLEVNPGTVNRNRLKAYRDSGVNRINIGVQSFQPDHLTFLGRIHSAEEAVESIRAARQSGFMNIGIDLIYGLPGQTPSSLIDDLKQAVSYDPEHLSCYMLTYEPGTRLYHQKTEGRFSPLSDEQSGNLLEKTAAYLDANGYLQYEISNFAKSSELISRHNSKYWDFIPYLGLGPSAHSFFPPERRWNHSSLPLYMADIENGKLPTAGGETLTRQQQIMGAIYLGLRKTQGINLEAFDRLFSLNFVSLFENVSGTLADDGLLAVDSNDCRLTRKGMRFLDSVAKMLISAGKF